MLEVALVCISQLPRAFVLLFLPGNEIEHYPIRKGMCVEFPVQVYRTNMCPYRCAEIMSIVLQPRGPDSVVCIATGYGLDGPGF